MANDKDEKKPSPIKNPFRKRRAKVVVMSAGEESDVTDDESYLPTSLRFDPNDMSASSTTSSTLMSSYNVNGDQDSDEETLTSPEYGYAFNSPGSGSEEENEDGDENEDDYEFLSRVDVLEDDSDDDGADAGVDPGVNNGTELALMEDDDSVVNALDFTPAVQLSKSDSNENIENEETQVKEGESMVDLTNATSYKGDSVAEKIQQKGQEEGESVKTTKDLLPQAQAQSPTSVGQDVKAQPQSPLTEDTGIKSSYIDSTVTAELPLATNGEDDESDSSTSNKENEEPQQQPAAPQSTIPPSALRKSSSSNQADNTVVRRSILRIGSRDRSMSPNDNGDISRASSNGNVKKAVSFADEYGGTIHKQHTIAVSPNKLTRRVRRNKQPFPSQFDTSDDKMQEGVMGRVLVLLMDPPTKQYELTSLPYPLVSNENGIVGPTQLSVLMGLVSKSASYEPLRDKSYLGFCRPGDPKELSKHLTVVDYSIVKDEVLIAIPEGYTPEDCLQFSEPILQDKRLVRLLKKLKKHERKAEKKRRMARKSMKPDRNGLGFGGNGDEFMDNKDGLENTARRDWASILAGGVAILFLILFVVGAFNAIQNEKKIGTGGKKVSSRAAKKQTCLGRGVFCKPFGVQSQEEDGKSKFRWLQEISEWKLEGDDLMI